MPVSSCLGSARGAPRRRPPRQLGVTSIGTQPTFARFPAFSGAGFRPHRCWVTASTKAGLHTVVTTTPRPAKLIDMVGATLRMIDPNVAFTAVRASRGKVVRAEPLAATYQQGRVHHIGTVRQLQDQMTNFTSDIDRAAAGYSPDRVDALVWAWAFSELLVEPMKGERIFELYRRNAEAAEQRDKPQASQTTWAIGAMEWLAEQKKSR
jgi:hypothetical protein